MDVDAYVAAHRAEWGRLEDLVGRRRLTGDEVDDLVELYQRVATHLSVIRSASPDPALVARLTTLVARARSAVTGSHSPAWRDAARFLTVSYPAALYRSMRWWAPVGLAFCLAGLVVGAWVASTPEVQATIAAPEDIRRLVEEDFENYYSSAPAESFAAQVATNNAWVAALCIALGVMIAPVGYILWQNAANVGIAGGLMAANGRLDQFFGLILPHGMLELTCVFVAAGAGLRLGWAWVDPGPRSRSQALAEEGLAAGGIALGLVLAFLVAGVIEAYVTPSGLPTWARVGIGLSVWAGFVAFLLVLGRRAVRAGELGDVRGAGETDRAPVAG